MSDYAFLGFLLLFLAAVFSCGAVAGAFFVSRKIDKEE